MIELKVAKLLLWFDVVAEVVEMVVVASWMKVEVEVEMAFLEVEDLEKVAKEAAFSWQYQSLLVFLR